MASSNTQVDKRIGNRIRRARKQLGLTQREMSKHGVTYAYISRIESGQRRPSLSAVITLAELFRARAFALSGERAREGDIDGALLWRQYADDMTALSLTAGRVDEACPFCGRHEHTGGTNDRRRHDPAKRNGAHA